MNFATSRSKLFKYSPNQDNGSPTNKNKQFITKVISIQNSHLESMMEIYRWRVDTQFPIVRVKNVQILSLNTDNESNQQMRNISIGFEELQYTFADLSDIPLFKVLYLLKQTLIGLERLYTKFGPFEFNEKMAFIDQSGKCKVWVNEKVQLNQVFLSQLKQPQFLSHAYQIFQSKTVETKQSISFYESIKNCKQFFSALECIDSFVQRQKLKVLTFFRMQPSSNGATSIQKQKKKLDLNMTMSKKPNFLNKIEFDSSQEQSLTNSKRDIYDSTKFMPQKTFFSKPQMKISGDTAAQSQTNVKSSNQMKSPMEFNYSRKTFKDKQLWNSYKSELHSKLQAVRKFSNNIRNPYSPTIHIHEPINFPSPLNEQITNQISESMTFCDLLQKASRSSSADDKQKLTHKTKQVFNVNGWELKVNSLFSNNEEFKKSFCEKNSKNTIKRQPVKLDLLDKCATNLCQSFIEDHQKM